MSEHVNDTTDSTFETDVLKSDRPVLVDFWAAWCAPCRMLAPTVESVAEKYAGSARVVKLNVDDNPSVSQRYGIKGIPTLILFKNGKKKSGSWAQHPKPQFHEFWTNTSVRPPLFSRLTASNSVGTGPLFFLDRPF